MAGVTARRARKQRAFRWIVVIVLGLFFLVPLFAMLMFTIREPDGHYTFETWRQFFDWPQLASTYPDLWTGMRSSGELVLLTVALMLVLLVPTVVWVRLRLPWLRRVIEFICLLPLTIPAIVLVVGLAPVYAWVTYFLGGSPMTLTFAYTVLVLPYAYRAIDAGLSGIDVKTLSEAARSLGSSWGTVMWRVVLPNIRSAVLSASFLTVALVLGEFTIASLLNRTNLQVAVELLGKSSATMSVAVSLAALVLAFILLFALSFAGRRRGQNRRSIRETS
ncbi:ABC transporter permease [Rugosimonospora africana]|uniref:ABC transporter permease n=1 Tax=Rugosimonospora africana TaxID=556532 RepID=A0A8J3QXB4_9ACTN|nr:ABC transporter permease subunit [Rugosimonospora africana]GIH17528.1 ABC transporter permease [Rugosimonospora africana]